MVQLELEGDTVSTVVVTRDCANVVCEGGEQCRAGVCVSPECSPERPDLCPEPECASDTDCAAGLDVCAVARCASGVCLTGQDAASCGAGEVCNPFDGCIPESCATPRSQVIANWDVVPRQTLRGPTDLGVMAFHEHGSRVVFSVDGAEVGRSASPTMNARTGAPEHIVTLDPADYPDGPLILSARAEPLCLGHDARDLPDLMLFVNAGGTLAEEARYVDCIAGSDEAAGTELDPFRSVDRALSDVPDGGTVWLAAGDCYIWPSDDAARERWTTIRPLEGLPAGAVEMRLRDPDAMASVHTRLRFVNVRLTAGVPDRFTRIVEVQEGGALWLDGTELDADPPDNEAQLNAPIYLTDGLVHGISQVRPLFMRGTRVRNVRQCIGIQTNHIAVNVDVVGVGRAAIIGGFHPDGFVENLIVYGVRATRMGPQSLFGIQGRTQDVAIVNTLVESHPPGQVGAAQLLGGWEHALFWHLTVVGTPTIIRGEVLRVAVENGLFLQLGESEEPVGWRVRNNHYLVPNSSGETLGDFFTLGDAAFVDAANDDYRLSPESPATNTGRELLDVPFDALGRPFGAGSRAAGAFAPE
ncbi:MAG: hypothetical protein AB8I08_25625 [Sandaracinaceae bacterium]